MLIIQLHLSALICLLSKCALAISPSAAALNEPVASIQASIADNGGLDTEGTDTLDGTSLKAVEPGLSTEEVVASSIPKSAWTATADSSQPGFPATNVLDENLDTMWHTTFLESGAPLPHNLTIDMKQIHLINSIAYIPRQDGQKNGNIGGHQIFLSTDGIQWNSPVATGTYQDDNSTKAAVFEATNAQFVRLMALTEAGGRGPWTSCASFNIFEATVPAPPRGEGEWSPTIDFPIVPVSAAIEHYSGNVVVWSSYSPSTFMGSSRGDTLTATYSPTTGLVAQRNVSETHHDMFCEGLSMDSSGRFIVTGGNNANQTSIYDPTTNAWSRGADMKIPRGYQSMVTLSNANLFTIGGSWSGGQGGKNGEVFDATSQTWTLLPGAPVAPMLTNDTGGIFRQDNHAMLFGWRNGSVFQAGPSKAMNWYNTIGEGNYTAAGTRNEDGDAMCGNAIMYDATEGKILVVGGAVDYEGVDSTNNAHLITIEQPGKLPSVQTLTPLIYQRIFANAVVLPDGKVFIVGGQILGKPFSDMTSQMVPEMWDPVSATFRELAPQPIPRNYHSVAILMPDAAVLSAGGGLCGDCAANHYDGQIYSPSYLFNTDGTRATRPVIYTASSPVTVGETLMATTDSAVTAWSLVRAGSTTHAVNTDQRRIPLNALANGNTYSMSLPTDAGILIPGYYMLFAMNAAGVPSVAKFVQVAIRSDAW